MTGKHSQTPDINPINYLRDQLKRNPNNGQAWFGLAQLLSQAPPSDDLFHAIEQSIKSLPENFQVWLLAVNVQQRMKGATAALQWLEQTARLNPEIVAPQLALASMLMADKPGAAISLCDKLLNEFPKENVAHTGLAISIRADAYRMSGKWSEALDDYRELEKTRSNDSRLLNNIGCCLIGLEKNESAAPYFKKALRLNPDFVEAQINAGLIYASQSNYDEAISMLAKIPSEPTTAPGTSQAVKSILENLSEHKRLVPVLRESIETSSINALNSALQKTPENLLAVDKHSLDKLWAIAAKCRDFEFNPQRFAYEAEADHLHFAEALAQCRLEDGVTKIADIYRNSKGTSAELESFPAGRKISKAYRMIKTRANINVDQLQGEQGEAWLRYWHANIMEENPSSLPGQYKLVASQIGNHTSTPPNAVASTFRTLLNEILPTLPGAFPRAVFLFITINLIHGFADGNGRLARFVMNWEAESGAFPPIVISPAFRKQVAKNLAAVISGGELELLMGAFENASAGTADLLKQLGI